MSDVSENVSGLTQYWDWQSATVAIGANFKGKVLGSDPRRWIVYFMESAAVVGNNALIPISQNVSIKFTLGAGSPTRFSQRDDGLLVPSEWFFDNTGGAGFNLFILSLRWLG